MAQSEQINQRPEPELIRSRLRECLTARNEVDWAYLFGSFLDGSGYQDIDVGLYLRPALSRDQVFGYEMEISTDLTMILHAPVDIHVLNDAPLSFQFSALGGELLLARDEDRLTDFVEGVGSAIAEFAHHSESYLREVLT